MGKKHKKGVSGEEGHSRPIAENRKAHHRFEVLDMLECGVVLTGSEVKSLRLGKVSLEEAYGRVREGEAWLVGCDIPEYKNASLWNHVPKRSRKLLMRRRDLRHFARRAYEKGLTLVPLKMYFNERGLAKIQLGLCRGKKLYDKREEMKRADVKRDLARAQRRR